MKLCVHTGRVAKVEGFTTRVTQPLKNLNSTDQLILSSRLSFQNLKSLTVTDYDNLESLIPLSVARNLVNLQCLRVEHCKAMEEVVFTQEYSEQDLKTSLLMGIKISIFPRLDTLLLKHFPNLERFCAMDCVDYPSLIKLKMKNCQNFGTLLTNSMRTIENEIDSAGSMDEHRFFDHKVI